MAKNKSQVMTTHATVPSVAVGTPSAVPASRVPSKKQIGLGMIALSILLLVIGLIVRFQPQLFGNTLSQSLTSMKNTIAPTVQTIYQTIAPFSAPSTSTVSPVDANLPIPTVVPSETPTQPSTRVPVGTNTFTVPPEPVIVASDPNIVKYQQINAVTNDTSCWTAQPGKKPSNHACLPVDSTMYPKSKWISGAFCSTGGSNYENSTIGVKDITLNECKNICLANANRVYGSHKNETVSLCKSILFNPATRTCVFYKSSNTQTGNSSNIKYTYRSDIDSCKLTF